MRTYVSSFFLALILAAFGTFAAFAQEAELNSGDVVTIGVYQDVEENGAYNAQTDPALAGWEIEYYDSDFELIGTEVAASPFGDYDLPLEAVYICITPNDLFTQTDPLQIVHPSSADWHCHENTDAEQYLFGVFNPETIDEGTDASDSNSKTPENIPSITIDRDDSDPVEDEGGAVLGARDDKNDSGEVLGVNDTESLVDTGSSSSTVFLAGISVLAITMFITLSASRHYAD